jgi:MFS family permease
VARGVTWKVAIVPACYLLIALPLGELMAHAPTVPLVIAGMFATGLFISGWLGPLYGMIISLTPSAMRGRVNTIAQCATTLFGMSVGPLMTGVLSDYYGSGAKSLRPALTIVLLFELWAVLHLVLAMRILRNRARAEATAG